MLYDPPRFGNLCLMQIGDTHGYLQPSHVREASFYMGVGDAANKPPYLVGESFLEHYRVLPQTLWSHAHASMSFEDMATVFGKTGGYAHIASLIKYLRASRPDSLLLDCGDSWLGSGLSLLAHASPQIEATLRLGVDAMTGDGEFALGASRLREVFAGNLHGKTAFLGHNVTGEEGYFSPTRPYSVHFVGGTPIGVVGVASHLSERYGRVIGLHFELDETRIQFAVDMVRSSGVRFVVVLSHAGLPIDLKLASRLRGVDVIMSGHSHDAIPEAMVIRNPSGRTLVTTVGAHGKFVGVLDVDLREGRMRDYRYRLIPVYANLIPADAEMQMSIDAARKPFAERLDQPLANTESTLFRRDQFMGTMDQLMLQGLLEASDAEIAFGPGMRCGSSVLSGGAVTYEDVLNYAAIPHASLRSDEMTGAVIQARLEEWLDHVFSPDPYVQSGEDMVRSMGLTYTCNPAGLKGQRVSDVRVAGKPLVTERRYKVVSWGLFPSSSGSTTPMVPILVDYLKKMGKIKEIELRRPNVIGLQANKGIA